jgi:hypothetical protein
MERLLTSIHRILKSLKRAFIAIVLLVPMTFACSIGETLGEENAVAAELTIPQIDLNAPAIVETATFAMG